MYITRLKGNRTPMQRTQQLSREGDSVESVYDSSGPRELSSPRRSCRFIVWQHVETHGRHLSFYFNVPTQHQRIRRPRNDQLSRICCLRWIVENVVQARNSPPSAQMKPNVSFWYPQTVLAHVSTHASYIWIPSAILHVNVGGRHPIHCTAI